MDSRLAIKYTPNIFLISVYDSALLQQDICCVKVCVCVCVLKNWKQLFLSKLFLYLLGKGYSIYFLFLTYVFTRYLQNIDEKKIWNHEIPTKKKFQIHKKKIETHKTPRRKDFGPTKYPREKIRRDGTRPTRPTMARDPWKLGHSC